MRLFALLLLLPTQLCAQTSVLFVGNSYIYSNDLPNMLRQLSESLGENMTVASSAPGGYRLTQHATYEPTLTAIASQPWDFVILQEQSQLGALPTELSGSDVGAAILVDSIEGNHECTYPVFYMTWGRENGDALNCDDFPYMCTYTGMQQALHDNYVAMAEQNDGRVAPVGEAWRMVRETHPEIALYVSDGSHPSAAGTYLAANVLFCTLFGTSTASSSYTAGLDATVAATLRSIASTTVLNATAPWNLDVPNGTDASFTSSSSTAPNNITYHHAGAGTHLWTCSNGQTSTAANATFTFSAAGTYTITHVYDDPCGNSDTATWTLTLTSVGVPETAEASRTIRGGPRSLLVSPDLSDVHITIHDTRGSIVTEAALRKADKRFILEPGSYVWTITQLDGDRVSGRCVVP
ncbi:MAG: DUF4886 domain-containing protein [Flavobacteriales bacterium]